MFYFRFALHSVKFVPLSIYLYIFFLLTLLLPFDSFIFHSLSIFLLLELLKFNCIYVLMKFSILYSTLFSLDSFKCFLFFNVNYYMLLIEINNENERTKSTNEKYIKTNGNFEYIQRDVSEYKSY